MRSAPTYFVSDHFTFKQVARHGNLAIYRKTKPYARKDSPWLFETFEVVRLIARREHSGPNGVIIPAAELYPNSNNWGTHGWSLQTLEDAWDKFNSLKAL